ncbi:YdbH domain-containing protein [Pseudomonas benzenivorans]|uniref:YdbH domain-containing protein n=1 Tax=Pseudomonas benzenivorans TaxID=556533 RepID=A0ABZ0PSG6_9PSED|nr:YdbH domain-containing protein [Pseudomonas benzenivorans]WPC03844.1 YdbH domain-containing protein [Pseudomonas benzenivorans]
MPSRHLWLRLTCLLLVLALLGGYGYASWMQLLERHHIQRLDWRGPSLSQDGLHLAHLGLHQQGPAGELRMQAEHIRLGWQELGSAAPFWQQIEVSRLALDWRPAPQPPASAEPSLDLQRLANALPLVPHSLRVDQLTAELPCAKGRCTLRGEALQLGRSQTLLNLRLTLLDAGNRLAWRTQLRSAADALEARLVLAINGRPQLELRSSLQDDADGMLWRGELSAPTLGEAAALRDWLNDWTFTPDTQPPETPRNAALSASWQLQLTPGAPNLKHLRQASGRLEASGTLPEPWPIPGIGQLQGDFSLALRSRQGQWLAEQLTAELTLQQPFNDWQRALPQALRSDSLQLRIAASPDSGELPDTLAGRALPLTLDLRGKGPTPFELRGRLALTNAPPWALQLSGAQFETSSPNLYLGDWAAHQVAATLHFDAYLDRQRLSLDLGAESLLRAAKLSGPDLRLERLSADLSDLQLNAQLSDDALRDWRLEGTSTLTAQRLSHAALHPQGWRWEGRLNATEERLELDGQVAADVGLRLPFQLQYDDARGLHAHARLPELFLRAGNPLAKTLEAWPALLELNKGRLSATASLTQRPGHDSPLVRLELTGKGLAGLYDRTALSDLDAHAQVRLDHGELNVELTELRLAEADPGIPLGPLLLRGHYRAPITRMKQGTLQLRRAESGLLGGNVRLQPGQWNLSQDNLLLPLELRGLRLERLFTLYPAEGLAGSGVLDGQLPLRLGPSGIQISRGQLAARAPGGHLQFRSERMQALGRSNPAMQLVTQSLEDFRFTTLRSRVDYDPQGKLLLTMRLEGQNPAIEQGRPIHFNINLEEDLPTLLASLQLTDKVNEIIRRRVQQRMLERRAANAPKEP